MKFGDVLKLLIDISNITITDLADKVEYDRTYISKWINNKEIPIEKNGMTYLGVWWIYLMKRYQSLT